MSKTKPRGFQPPTLTDKEAKRLADAYNYEMELRRMMSES